MARLIFVLLDGLNASTARRCMSALHALTSAGLCRYTELDAGLPPLSRPLYATLLSGLTPAQSGILHNDDARLCPAPTIFHHAQSMGLTTAAAAYHWISELCNRAPFLPERDRLTDEPSLPIAHGLFYSHDAYPDEELFRDAEALRLRWQPHLLLVHSMGIDCAGHTFGADAPAYRTAARAADGLLARHLPLWLEAGYAVLITSDHGMDAEHSHYDDREEVRRVPLWLAGQAWEKLPQPSQQSAVAELMLAVLNIATGESHAAR